MGNFDITTKNYINDPIVFADICNYILYEGKQVINPNNLTEKSISEFVILNKNNSNYSKAIEEFRLHFSDRILHLLQNPYRRVKIAAQGNYKCVSIALSVTVHAYVWHMREQ